MQINRKGISKQLQNVAFSAPIRFIWELETIRSLHENDTPNSDSNNIDSDFVTEKKKHSKRKSPINLNY